jgi:heme/copper-type cytochrome/quinol oxidase subunit 2
MPIFSFSSNCLFNEGVAMGKMGSEVAREVFKRFVYQLVMIAFVLLLVFFLVVNCAFFAIGTCVFA